ncbi:hypothetical protein G4O51_11005 [Candidatus Bathyarchaeota archaeon A05DMB-2]|jgi:hypothetical protein|nr:hypothetical protein [Candidatus Bathyarchaeota archaeon A05DMB-2]
MRKETIEIGEEYGPEYKGRYTFQEISWAKRSRIIQKHTKYSQVTGQVQSSDYVAIQAETIMASLKEQPEHKPITLEKLLNEENGVPIGLGELFSRIANRLNSLTVEESRFLSEQSAEANRTQQSLSTDSAKSSDGQSSSLENSQPKQSSNSS